MAFKKAVFMASAIGRRAEAGEQRVAGGTGRRGWWVAQAGEGGRWHRQERAEGGTGRRGQRVAQAGEGRGWWMAQAREQRAEGSTGRRGQRVVGDTGRRAEDGG